MAVYNFTDDSGDETVLSSSIGQKKEVREAWLARCAPIFMQPEVDVKNRHPLLKVFYKFGEDTEKGEIFCDLIVVYEGEASYRRSQPHNLNRIATFFYMTYNKRTFGRTADLDYLTIAGINFSEDPNVLPWLAIRTRDHSGEQTWAQGSKGNCLSWFSLFHHYNWEAGYESWQKFGERPIVFINTQNHLMGLKNNNPGFELHRWDDYVLMYGGCLEAEAFAQNHVLPKPVLWTPFSICRRKRKRTKCSLVCCDTEGNLAEAVPIWAKEDAEEKGKVI